MSDEIPRSSRAFSVDSYPDVILPGAVAAALLNIVDAAREVLDADGLGADEATSTFDCALIDRLRATVGHLDGLRTP